MAMAHYYLELPRPPTSAKMLNLDENGFEVEYKVTMSVWKQTKPRISKIRFVPALKEVSEVRPRVVAMAEEAEIKRNRKYPILYSPPRDFILIISALLVIAFFRSDSVGEALPGFLKSHWTEIRSQIGGKRILDLLLTTLAKVHVSIESGFTLHSQNLEKALTICPFLLSPLPAFLLFSSLFRLPRPWVWQSTLLTEVPLSKSS